MFETSASRRWSTPREPTSPSGSAKSSSVRSTPPSSSWRWPRLSSRRSTCGGSGAARTSRSASTSCAAQRSPRPGRRERAPALVPSARHGSWQRPIIGTTEQRKFLAALGAAGIKGHGDLATFIAGKVCGAVAFGRARLAVPRVARLLRRAATTFGWALAGAVLLGWRMPDIVLSRLAARRRVRLEQGMPDALDLLVICAEAGLSLDQAIEQVGRDLLLFEPRGRRGVRRDSRGNARLAGSQLKRSKTWRREQVLRACAASSRRSTSRSGSAPRSPNSLRVLAAEMRTERLARFEERAARLPVLLTLPLMGFILPSMMIVIGTPLILRMVDFLHKAVAGSSGLGAS